MSRPKLPKTKIKKSVTFEGETLKRLTSLGKGNLSAGIELSFQEAKYFKDRCKELEKQIELLKPSAPTN